MNIKILVDMNLSPLWVNVFEKRGWKAVHWSSIGDSKASDHVIMAWARANHYAVFTHDLDFGAILAATHAEFPSVIQVRTQDTMPEFLEPILIPILDQYGNLIYQGVLIIIDEDAARVRILPLN